MANNKQYEYLAAYGKKTKVLYDGSMAASMTVTRVPATVAGTLAAGQNISVMVHPTIQQSGDAQTAVMTVSLTINACTLCYLVSQAALGCLLANLPIGLQTLTKKLINLHNEQSWMLPKM